MMKKIVLLTAILLAQVLMGAIFENTTDMKSKYEFDIGVATTNEELAIKLQRFQDGKATEEEIQKYLNARDTNETNETKFFQKDVQVDASLQLSKKPQEKNWFISLYDSLFGQSDSNMTSAKGGE